MSPAPEPDSADLVAKRQRFIERQISAKPDRVNVAFAGQQPRGMGPPNRHGLPKLPASQRMVTNWPLLDLGDMPDIATTDWGLEISGLVEREVTLDWDALQALPQTSIDADFHCVTGWSRMDMTFEGVTFQDLCRAVVPQEAARFCLFTGYDVAPGTDVSYTTNLPLERALDPDVMLVTRVNGEPLAREHGGPLRMVTPRLYAWKGTKWLKAIRFAAEDEPGFWEVRGYSNTAEPWFDDRYSR